MGWREAVGALLGISTYEAAPRAQGLSLGDASVEEVRASYGGQLAPLPYTQTRWYLRDLENAQHAADAGDLSMAVQLMRAARTDGVFAGVLASLVGGVVKLPKKFRGNPEMAAALDVGHESVRSVFDEMFPPAELALLAADGRMLGISVGELRPVKGRDYPVFVRLDPEWLRYRWNENRWYYQSIAGLLPITPGDGRWILHVPGGRVAPWQHGIYRAIGRAWIPKEHARMHKDNWEGKLANPARAAVSPQGASEEQSQAWFQRVLAWGVNTVFGMKPGYDVKLIESNGRGWESFDKTAERSDREFMIAVAGQVGTTEGGVGFSNKDLFEAVRYDIIEDVATGLCYTLNTQGLPQWIVGRWGEEGLDNPVILQYDIARPKDRTAGASSLATAAGAMKALREELGQHTVRDSSGTERPLILDAGQFCAEFNVPVAGDKDNDGKPEPELASVIPIRAAGFDESDHPSDEDGEFSEGGSAGNAETRMSELAKAHEYASGVVNEARAAREQIPHNVTDAHDGVRQIYEQLTQHVLSADAEPLYKEQRKAAKAAEKAGDDDKSYELYLKAEDTKGYLDDMRRQARKLAPGGKVDQAIDSVADKYKQSLYKHKELDTEQSRHRLEEIMQVHSLRAEDLVSFSSEASDVIRGFEAHRSGAAIVLDEHPTTQKLHESLLKMMENIGTAYTSESTTQERRLVRIERAMEYWQKRGTKGGKAA